MKKNRHGICLSMPFLLMFSLVMTLMITGCTETELQDDRSEETDRVRPTIVSVDPENNVNTVSLTARPSVIFSEDMKVESLTSASFAVKKGNTDLQGSVTYSGRIATFNPSAPFEPNTVYTCLVTTSVKDIAGNALAVNYSWSFTTGGLADVTAPTVISVSPASNATSVALGTNPTVTFSESMSAATINSATFLLKKGSTALPGTVTISGNTATFDPSATLEASTVYTCTITTSAKDASGNSLAANYTWNFTTGAQADVTAPAVLSVSPAGNATSVALSTNPSATFSEAMNAATINTTSFTVKKGSTVLSGTVTYSGTTATFDPTATLEANTVYTCTVTTAVKDMAGNALASNYVWSFTTGALADVTAPTVISVIPSGNATSVAVSIKPSVTFSEVMNPSTITTSSFTVKKGSTVLSGTVSYSGTTATFNPSVSLEASTIYTCTVTTAAKDASGNALAANYTWNFTTGAPADVTAPTVQTVAPANNATSVSVGITPAVTFSEPMNPATITSSSFTLKQGTTTVAGTVSYSGTTATFAPSAALAGNTVYTATVTTSAKDAAGNSLASNYIWSFTTVATSVAKSFSADVVPILNKCNTCHTHNWTPSSTPSIFHSNLVSSGHINMTTPTSGRIYTKLSGGHPSSTITSAEKTIVLTWITEGSKNN